MTTATKQTVADRIAAATLFYATCDCNGPISVRIEAESIDDALRQIDRHGREWIDEPRLDAEDDLSDVCWEGWTEEQVTAEMQRLGWSYIYQTDIAGDWCLWEADPVDPAEPEYIVVQATNCDGGIQVARVAPGEDESACARRYGACILSYGPEDERGASSHHYTHAEAHAEVRRIEAEDAEYEARQKGESAPTIAHRTGREDAERMIESGETLASEGSAEALVDGLGRSEAARRLGVSPDCSGAEWRQALADYERGVASVSGDAPAMSDRETRMRSCGDDLICDGCGEVIAVGDARFPDETRAVFCSVCDDEQADDDYAHLAPYDQGDAD